MTRSSHASAEEIAISGLGFLAADPGRLERFLALSGLAGGDIRSAAAKPGFLAGVLRHIMDDDRIAEAFARETGLKPEDLARAARALGAGGWERDLP
jgi:hypothetical protein